MSVTLFKLRNLESLTQNWGRCEVSVREKYTNVNIGIVHHEPREDRAKPVVRLRLRAETLDDCRPATDDYTSGCCWVMQCKVPKPHTRSPQ